MEQITLFINGEQIEVPADIAEDFYLSEGDEILDTFDESDIEELMEAMQEHVACQMETIKIREVLRGL